MKKLLSITMALSVLLLGACGTTNKTEKQDELTKITIGLMPSLAAVPYIYALEEGLYKEAGLDVEFITFRAANERDAALYGKQLDGVSTDMVAVGLYLEQGYDMVVSAATEEIFRVVANKDYAQQIMTDGVVDLTKTDKGTVGISEKTVIEYLADQIMSKYNITHEKVGIPKVPDRKASLDANQINMANMPEPFPSLTVKDGGVEVWRNTNDNLNVTVLSFYRDFADKNAEALKKFHQVTDEAVKLLENAKYDDYKQYIVKHNILTDDSVNLVEEQKFSKLVKPSEEQFNNVMNWMVEREFIKKAYDLKTLQFNW